MKKFRFALETVLDYRDQVLDNLRSEHAVILARVRRQEEILDAVCCRYDAANQEFRDKKASGMTVADAMGYETGLRVLDMEIQMEMQRLEEMRQEELAKRDEVVEARKDTASLEKLREKKRTAYDKEMAKSEELFIEELVSGARVLAANNI